MVDWLAFAEWPSDLRRAGTVSASLLNDLPRPGPTADLDRLFVEAAGCLYFVPEGEARRIEDNPMLRIAQRALAGDNAAKGQVSEYYFQHFRSGQNAEARVAYGAALGAFLVTQQAGAHALAVMSSALSESVQLPTPRMVELQSLLWCIAMHGIGDIDDDDVNKVAVPLTMEVKQLIDQINQRRESLPDSEEKSILSPTYQLFGILFSCIGATFAKLHGSPFADFEDNSRGLAQNIEEYTHKRWPTVSWVDAFYRAL